MIREAQGVIEKGIFSSARGWEEERYFKGLIEGKEYGIVRAQITGELAYLHLKIFVWSQGVLREMKEDFQELKDILKKDGVKKLLVAIEDDDPKFEKFIALLGFPRMRDYFWKGQKYRVSRIDLGEEA